MKLLRLTSNVSDSQCISVITFLCPFSIEETAQCLMYIASLLLSGSRRKIGWKNVFEKLYANFRELINELILYSLFQLKLIQISNSEKYQFKGKHQLVFLCIMYLGNKITFPFSLVQDFISKLHKNS